MINKVDRAKHFATIAHGNQTYNDDVPYLYHLEMVNAELMLSQRVLYLNKSVIYDTFRVITLTILEELECANYLHDVIEDTNRSYSDINKRFGLLVSEICYSVTNEIGRNRKERNIKTYPKIRSNPFAQITKLCDRNANVRYGLETNSNMPKMYKEENTEFLSQTISSEEEFRKSALEWLEKIFPQDDFPEYQATLKEAINFFYGLRQELIQQLNKQFKQI